MATLSKWNAENFVTIHGFGHEYRDNYNGTVNELKVHITTLGCPKNQVDSEKTLWALEAGGARLTDDERLADLLLVNTCGFIEEAKQESIDAILALSEIKKSRPGVKLAVLGCLSERYKEDLAAQIPDIDSIYGVSDLATVVKELAPGPIGGLPGPDNYGRVLTTPNHWAYLKISEGCSNKCSFCVIPAIRGPYVSRDPGKIIEEARSLARGGVKELILVAQDTTLYGADIKLDNGLANLLEALDGVGKLEWIRVLYMYPPLVNDRLLRSFATLGKVVPYFDIPFQHASDRILADMNRHDTGRSIRELVGKIRKTVHQAVIRSSFIVGFPGETDSDFEESLMLLDEIKLDHMGAFRYSPEEGSGAYNLPDPVAPDLAADRLNRLMEKQRGISKARLRRNVGQVLDVMVDDIDPDETLLTGRTRFQAPEIDGLVILDSVIADPGSILPVKITGSTDYDLIGSNPHE